MKARRENDHQDRFSDPASYRSKCVGYRRAACRVTLGRWAPNAPFTHRLVRRDQTCSPLEARTLSHAIEREATGLDLR